MTSPFQFPVFSEKETVNGGLDPHLLSFVKIFCDGHTQIEEIYLNLIGEGFGMEEVHRGVQLLIQQGSIEFHSFFDGSQLPPDYVKRFASQIRTFSELAREKKSRAEKIRFGYEAQLRLFTSSVLLIGDPALQSEITLKLAMSGIVNTPCLSQPPKEGLSERPDVVVCCSGSYHPDETGAVNLWCVENGYPVVYYQKVQFGFEIGPFVTSSEAACYACLTERKKSVMGMHFDLLADNKEPWTIGVVPGLDFLAIDIVRFITSITGASLKNKILQYNVLTGELMYHPVLQLPRCPVCGSHKINPSRKIWKQIYE